MSNVVWQRIIVEFQSVRNSNAIWVIDRFNYMIVSKRFQAAVVRYSNVLPSIECEYIVDEVLTPGIINH